MNIRVLLTIILIAVMAALHLFFMQHREEGERGVVRRECDGEDKRWSALALENQRLLHENQLLRRKIYLLDLRRGACPVGGFLGQGEDYDVRWSCYPSSLMAKYCMVSAKTGWGKDVKGNCERHSGLLEKYRDELKRNEWKPPRQPSSNQESEDSYGWLAKVGPPYAQEQFTPGFYETMRMTNTMRTYWDLPTLSEFTKIIKRSGDVSPVAYPGAHKDMQTALDGIGGLRGKCVLVVGSISPWLESIALHNEGTSVTTVDYNKPLLDPELRASEPRLVARQMTEVMESGDTFDVIVSYSSIEHDGLGRYGDPLNPDGDLAAQKEIFLMLKPEGKYILGIPDSQHDAIHYVSMRYYGPVRMPVLAQGWRYDNSVDDGKISKRFKLGPTGTGHIVLILSKPRLAAFALEETYGEEGCALKCAGSKEGTVAECFPQDKDGNAC